jgi:hypothetical protein
VAEQRLEETADLRYLGADSVRCSEGNLSGFRVCTEDAQSIGKLAGILISPSERRLAYLVVDAPGFFVHRRYLLPLDAGAVFADESRTLRVGVSKDELDLMAASPRFFPTFSDDDLLEALFPSRSAEPLPA